VNELKKCALALCGDKAADDVDDSQVLKLLPTCERCACRQTANDDGIAVEGVKGLPDSPWDSLNAIGLAKILRPFGPQRELCGQSPERQGVSIRGF